MMAQLIEFSKAKADRDARLEAQNITYVSFFVDQHLLGISVDQVQEVLTLHEMNHVPLANKSIAGLLNLRGQIVTGINLRASLDLPDPENRDGKMFVVVRNQDELFALIVDQVGDVLNLPRSGFQISPSNVDPLWQKCCEGLHRLERELLIVLNVSNLLELTKGV